MQVSLVALVESLGLVPSTYMAAQNNFNSSFRRSDALSWLLRVSGMHMIHRLTCKAIRTHINKNKRII